MDEVRKSKGGRPSTKKYTQFKRKYFKMKKKKPIAKTIIPKKFNGINPHSLMTSKIPYPAYLYLTFLD